MITYAPDIYWCVDMFKKDIQSIPKETRSKDGSFEKYLSFLDQLKAFINFDNEAAKKGNPGPKTIYKFKKFSSGLDDSWKETFETPVRKGAKSTERVFKSIISNDDLYMATSFHWAFSQLTTFCAAGGRTPFENLPRVIANKLISTLTRKLDRIEAALENYASSGATFSAHVREYLNEMALAKNNPNHPLQADINFNEIFLLAAPPLETKLPGLLGVVESKGEDTASVSGASTSTRSIVSTSDIHEEKEDVLFDKPSAEEDLFPRRTKEIFGIPPPQEKREFQRQEFEREKPVSLSHAQVETLALSTDFSNVSNQTHQNSEQRKPKGAFGARDRDFTREKVVRKKPQASVESASSEFPSAPEVFSQVNAAEVKAIITSAPEVIVRASSNQSVASEVKEEGAIRDKSNPVVQAPLQATEIKASEPLKARMLIQILSCLPRFFCAIASLISSWWSSSQAKQKASPEEQLERAQLKRANALAFQYEKFHSKGTDSSSTATPRTPEA